MAGEEKRTVLGDVSVREAMRRQVVRLPASSSIESAIRFMTKYKISALLVTDDTDLPLGRGIQDRCHGSLLRRAAN